MLDTQNGTKLAASLSKVLKDRYMSRKLELYCVYFHSDTPRYIFNLFDATDFKLDFKLLLLNSDEVVNEESIYLSQRSFN
jgi:hypothetical protein